MNQAEADLILQIKSVGIFRAKELIDIFEVYEGAQVSAPKKRKDTFHSVLGEMIQAKMPKRGRKKGSINPNSARQKIFAALRDFLKSRKDSVPCADIMLHLEKVTGYSLAQCRTNANACPDVKRDYGKWSLITSNVRKLKAA